MTNSGYCSRYEWARLVLDVLGVNKFVRPVSMDVFNLPASRPKFSAMSNKALGTVLNVDIPAWQDAVRSFLRKG
jgi:dTDP-4-dehydrorhamnose reductase